MHVIVQHRVKDADFFFADIPGVADNAPAGVEPRLFCPSADRTAAVCLWEAQSLDDVRRYIDAATGDASENRYFVVSEEHALGLDRAGAT